MKRLLAFLLLVGGLALAGGYFGLRLDLSSEGLRYKLFYEETIYEFTFLNSSARLTGGVELYNEPVGQDYLTLYTGYEVDLPLGWVQVRVQSDTEIPGFVPRFEVSFLMGVSIP